MDISPEKLADAYRLMKTIREFEERMRSEYQQGKLPGFNTFTVIKRRLQWPPVLI